MATSVIAVVREVQKLLVIKSLLFFYAHFKLEPVLGELGNHMFEVAYHCQRSLCLTSVKWLFLLLDYFAVADFLYISNVCSI